VDDQAEELVSSVSIKSRTPSKLLNHPRLVAAQFEFSAGSRRLGGERFPHFSPPQDAEHAEFHAEKNQTEPLPNH